MSVPKIRLIVIGLWNMIPPATVRPTCITIFEAAKVVADVFSKKMN